MQGVGLGKWPQFLRDAAERAEANGPVDKTIVLAQLATPNKTTDASFNSGSNAQKTQESADFRARFDAATASAYQNYSHDCSGYLRAFLTNMGFADTPPRTANEFMEFVQRQDSGWKQVRTAEEAVQLSAAGHIVVAGLAHPGGHGHVEVVGSKMIRATLVGSHPMSPQVFSGASSPWKGARSQGEHTVADGWTNSQLVNVTYWVRQ